MDRHFHSAKVNMKRRDFVRSSVLTLSSALLAKSVPAVFAETPPNSDVKRVVPMFKCHFDAGFIDTQAAVVHRYVWTTGSWLLYEYLEQASPRDRRRMEQSIAQGDIAWHAIPFSWQTEMM